MAWTSPRTWVANAILTAAQLNTDIRDNLNYLKGLLDGTGTDVVAVPDELRIANDANFKLFKNGLNPELVFDAGLDGFAFIRATNDFQWIIANGLVLQLASSGKLTGAGFYSSGVFAVGAGATVGLTNPFGGTGIPRFVFGKYQSGTQTEGTTTIPIGIGPASTEKIRLTVAQAATITVQSTDSVSNSVIVYAIL